MDNQDLPSCVVFRMAANVEFDFSAISPQRAAKGPCPHTLANGVRYGVWNPGLLVVDFEACPDLTGGSVPAWQGSGLVPDLVTAAREHRLAITLRRVRLANALALCVTSAIEHASNDSSFVYDVLCNAFEMAAAKLAGDTIVINNHDLAILKHNAACDSSKHGISKVRKVKIEAADTSIDWATKLIQAEQLNDDFDAVTLASLSRHARVSHRQQSPDASLTLSWTVAEQLVEQAFYVFGVTKRDKVWPSKPSSAPTMSKTKLKSMNAAQQLDFLRANNLIGTYLAQRAAEVRKLRNALLHSGQVVAPRDSGSALTTLRDLFKEILDLRFITETAWSYRT